MKWVFALMFVYSNEAFAHARWSVTNLSNGRVFQPRNDSDGIKVAPCGSQVKGSSPVALKAGESIVLKFEETINHPGHFLFKLLDTNDANPVAFDPSVNEYDVGNTPGNKQV